jgi:hypothetical protein
VLEHLGADDQIVAAGQRRQVIDVGAVALDARELLREQGQILLVEIHAGKLHVRVTLREKTGQKAFADADFEHRLGRVTGLEQLVQRSDEAANERAFDWVFGPVLLGLEAVEVAVADTHEASSGETAISAVTTGRVTSPRVLLRIRRST